MSYPDLNQAPWRTSSLTGDSGDNCVEVAPLPDTVAVRDSKDRHGPALGFDHGEWTAFIDAARAGALAR